MKLRFQWFFVFIVSHFDICTVHFIWFNVIYPCWEFSLDLRAHCSTILVSWLLRFFVHNIVLVSVDFTSLLKKKLKMLSSMLTGMSCFLPWQLTNLSKCILISRPILLCTGIMQPPSDPNRILSSCARDFSSTAQHLVCTSESSVQRSTQTVFIVTLKLPSSTHSPTGCSIESSISCSI